MESFLKFHVLESELISDHKLSRVVFCKHRPLWNMGWSTEHHETIFFRIPPSKIRVTGKFRVYLDIQWFSPLLSDYRRRPVPFPMVRRNLNVTHRSKKKERTLTLSVP